MNVLKTPPSQDVDSALALEQRHNISGKHYSLKFFVLPLLALAGWKVSSLDMVHSPRFDIRVPAEMVDRLVPRSGLRVARLQADYPRLPEAAISELNRLQAVREYVASAVQDVVAMQPDVSDNPAVHIVRSDPGFPDLLQQYSDILQQPASRTEVDLLTEQVSSLRDTITKMKLAMVTKQDLRDIVREFADQ